MDRITHQKKIKETSTEDTNKLTWRTQLPQLLVYRK